MSTASSAQVPLRVGVSALFDPADTPHARTFMRALWVARNFVKGLHNVQWHFLDDGADPVRGADVARRFIDWGADVVIGHFSSDAAVAAAGLYRQAGIALLTPAATLDRLTLEHDNVFRCCPCDRRLAADLAGWLKARRWQVVHIDSDDSAHGRALAEALKQAAKNTGLRHVSLREQAQVEIFAGRLRTSRQHWHARRLAGSTRPLVLTDDAATARLGHAPPCDRDTYAIGFGHREAPHCPTAALHRGFFAEDPDTYYRESLLALHVVGQLATGARRASCLIEALRETRFETPSGAVAFERGERPDAFTRIWRIGETGLIPADRPTPCVPRQLFCLTSRDEDS